MGNYYSGMMNATGGSELRHHGILGQKWGVRRFQNKDGTWTEVGKKRRMSGYKDRRVENYFNRTNDADKLAKYESLDRSDRNRVFKAVLDLEGPHGHRGEMESKNFRSINPLKQRIARQMRDNRLNRGQKVMDELLGENAQAEVAYTGQPKKVTNSASDQIKKDIKAYQQRIRDRLPQIINEDSNSEVSKVLKDYKKYVSSDRKRLVANYKKQYHQEPNKDGLRDFVGEMIYKKKYGDRYAKAILKDMGYDTSPESVAWLKQQPWFYSGEVEDIIAY